MDRFLQNQIRNAGRWWLIVMACSLIWSAPGLTYGPGSAAVVTIPDPIRAGLDGCVLNVTITSDGVQSIDRLSIEVALDWVTPDLTAPSNTTALLGDGSDLTGNLSLGAIGAGPNGGTLLTLDPALVTPSGITDHVTISFTEQRGPGSQGTYTWYIQTAATDVAPLENIAIQPQVAVVGVAADGYGVTTISTFPDPLVGGMQDKTVTIGLTNDAPSGTSTQDIFDNWTTYGDGLWQVVSGILQCTNNSNQPTYFISDEILSDAIIYFEVRVNTSTDDDFVGWVFRFQDDRNFYVFDWKQLTQETAPTGRALKRIIDGDFNGDGVPGDDPSAIWEGRPEYAHIMARDSEPWVDFTWYPCKIEMIGDNLNLYVTNMTTPVLQVTDSNFTDGRFGPYTYSQPYTQFRNIAVERLTSYIETITIEVPQGWCDPAPGINFSALRGDDVDLTSFLSAGISGGGAHNGTILTLVNAHLSTVSPSDSVTLTFSPADVALRGGVHTFYTQTAGGNGILTDIASHPEIEVDGTLADGTGTAEIFSTPEDIFVGSINQYYLTVTSNGTYPLDAIRVSVPTGFTAPSIGSVAALRGDGVDLTANLTFDGMNALLSNAGIEAGGIANLVIFGFQDITAPMVAGYHTWTVATAGFLGNLTVIGASPQVYVNPPATPTATPIPDLNIWVPDDYSSIQQAIDNAGNGYTVWVRDGTFSGNCDFGGLSLTVRSENGPVNCIIDNGGSGNAFTFHNGEGATSIVQGFTIQNGNSPMGGAILCSASSPTIRNCIITANTADYGGGIACVSGSAPLITTNTISGNYANAYGGGIYSYQAGPIIANNAISGNSCLNDGGGLYLNGQSARRANPQVINCIFADNVSTLGGGIYCTDNAPSLTHNTHTNNYASGGGSGIYSDNASPIVTNCLLWNDVGDEIAAGGIGAPTVTYCSVQGGYAGEGNIQADPYFYRGFDGMHYLSQSASGQSQDSACVDAGSADASTFSFIGPDGAPVYLNELHTRTDMVSDAGIVDIGFHYCGCIPHAPQIIRVPTDFDMIQDAVDYALNGDIVVVANGTYTESIDVGGKAIIITSQNGPQYTIIDVNYAGPGFYFVKNEGPDSIIIGFTILRGGAGVVCNHASPKIQNCIIRQSQTAVQCTNEANPTITNCDISQNTNTAVTCDNSSPTISECTMTQNSGGNGGAISCSNNSNATVTTSTISNNTADQGGAIYIDNSSPTMTNCIVSNNVATGGSGGGGAIYLNYSDLVIVNFLITGCSAQYGGAIYCYYSAPSLTNCTLSGNVASISGGAFYCIDSDPYVRNCILWGDSPDEIYADSPSVPNVTYSNIQGGFSGTGNINGDPLFSTGLDGNYYISHIVCGQPADSPSIDAGGDTVQAINFIGPDNSVMHMTDLTTRTDAVPDVDVIDQGFHNCGCVPLPPPPASVIPATGPMGAGILIFALSLLLGALGLRRKCN